MVSTPLATIGITCFNARNTIRRSIKSAISQDWPDFEIIIVDDKSTDGSADVIASAIADVHNAKLVRHDRNIGVAAARNTILREAHGAFVAIFDDDDDNAPTRVRRQIEVLMEAERRFHTDRIACYAGGVRLYPNGYEVDAPAIGTSGDPPHGPELADYLLAFRRKPEWFYGSGVPTCALLARRDVFREMGGFDPKLRRLSDVDFAIRLALAGGYFVGTPERLYTRHMTQAAYKSAEAIRDARLSLVEKHIDYLKSIGRDEYARRWTMMRYWHFKRRYDRFAQELVGLLVRHPVDALLHIFATGPARLIHELKIRKGI